MHLIQDISLMKEVIEANIIQRQALDRVKR